MVRFFFVILLWLVLLCLVVLTLPLVYAIKPTWPMLPDRWNNDLMGWQSGGDPAAQLYNLYFDTPEQAAMYCTKHGFDFDVDQPNLPRDFHGKKSYAHNFLTEAVENKIKVKKPNDISRNHFKWSQPKQTQWLNQHRRAYGGEDHNPTGNAKQGKQTPVVNDGGCGPYGERS